MTAAASLRSLRDFAARRPPEHACNLCGREVPADPAHEHLFQPTERKILCACAHCATLFAAGGETRYRRVPTRVRELAEVQLSDAEWQAVGAPIRLAFFVRSDGGNGGSSVFPSPAGPVTSPLTSAEWAILEAKHVALTELAPEVEALLSCQLSTVQETFIAPIDACYRLVGVLRQEWQGISGGAAATHALERFFGELRQRAAGGARYA